MNKQTYYTLLALVPLNLTICSSLFGQEQSLDNSSLKSNQLFNTAADYYQLLQAEDAKVAPSLDLETPDSAIESGLVVPKETQTQKAEPQAEHMQQQQQSQQPAAHDEPPHQQIYHQHVDYQPVDSYKYEQQVPCNYPQMDHQQYDYQPVDSYPYEQQVPCSYPQMDHRQYDYQPVESYSYDQQVPYYPVESTPLNQAPVSVESPQGDPLDERLLLRGLVLSDSAPQKDQCVAGVTCCNVQVPGDAQELLNYLQCCYLNQPISMDLICQIKTAIRNYYRDRYRPFVIVEIPQQNITDGIVYVVIREAVVGDVRVFGNRWYDNEMFLRYVRLQPGQAITTEVLLTDVAWMNRNPFHRTDLVYTAGENEGETNVELVTTDRIPLYAYAGYDNTGNAVTGRNRFFTGFTWGNPFHRDDLLSYQYTTNNDFSRFSSHFADYVTPLPWRHVLMLYGGYAKVRRHHNVDFKQNGNSGQASIRYEVPFIDVVESRYGELRFGFDFKNTNNNLLFVGENEIPVIANEINIGQLMIQGNYEQDIWDNTFWASVEVYGQPGGWLPHSSNHDYSKIRLGAKNQYVYERLTAGYEYDIGDWLTVGLLGRGQWASTNLLPSEQFVIGGYDTVRGYQEYEVAVDRGMIFNFELRTQPISFLSDFSCCIPNDDLIFLLFCDYGVGSQNEVFGCRKKHRSHRAQDQLDFLQDEFHDFGGMRIKNFYEPRRFNLLSVGPGLRYRLNRYFTARLDWGIRLEKTPFEGHGSRVHFGIMASY